ncbi:MAG: hypothetical protein LC791_00740 [Acidobacteria bacterium]|nr:hypothetical protein [Acidobacteriota bacterium]
MSECPVCGSPVPRECERLAKAFPTTLLVSCPVCTEFSIRDTIARVVTGWRKHADTNWMARGLSHYLQTHSGTSLDGTTVRRFAEIGWQALHGPRSE